MSYRILVIDHDPSGVERIQRPLAEAGYDVVVSSDAAEAMATFEKVRPDLAVIEALLPEKPGPVLCQEIKDSPAGKATPVVLLLEPDEDKQARARALDLHGCDLLIERTIPEEELVELLEELLRARLAKVGMTGDATKDEAPRAAEPPEAGAAPKPVAEGAPGKLIDSNGVVDALSQLDAIIEDRTDTGRTEAAGDGAERAGAPLDREKVRRAERAGDFSFLNESTAGKKPVSSEKPGPAADGETASQLTAEIDQEIVDHIDALFASSEPGGPTLAEKKVLSWTFESNADEKSADSSPRSPEAAAEGPEKSSAKPAPAPGPKEEPAQESPVLGSETPAAAERKTEAVERTVSRSEQAATPQTPPPTVEGPVDARQTAPFAGASPRPARALPPPAEGRHGWWVVAACLSVVLIGGGLAILFLGGDSEPAATGEPAATTAARFTSTAADPAPAQTGWPGVAPVAEETTEGAESIAGSEPSIPAEAGPEAGPDESAALPAPTEQARARRTPSSPPVPRAETARPPARERTETGVERRSAAPAARPRPAEPRAAAPVVAEEAAPSPAESRSRAAPPQPEVASSAEAPVTTKNAEPAQTSAAEAKPTEATAAAPPESEAQPGPAASAHAESPVTAAPPPVPAEPAFEPPRLLEGSEPDYPAKSLKRASGERIQLKLLISDKGRISRVLVERGTRFKDLEAAAVSAVLRWKYRPATENGTAVEAWTTAEFTF